MSRQCRKCGGPLKNYAKIDGKRRNLGSRSFCLVCSPWGKHNTKKLDKIVETKSTQVCCRCGKEKPLGEFHKRVKKSNRRHSYCKDCLHDFQKKRWTERKKEAVRLFGGKCLICGYGKNYTAMVFHHRDSSQKSFDWNRLRLQSVSVMKNELEKCDLLCCRCHTELHNPDCLM